MLICETCQFNIVPIFLPAAHNRNITLNVTMPSQRAAGRMSLYDETVPYVVSYNRKNGSDYEELKKTNRKMVNRNGAGER